MARTFVEPESTPVTMAAIAERSKRLVREAEAALEAAAFTPSAMVDFSRLTTAIETTVPATLALGITTSISSGNLITAAQSLEGQLNTVLRVLNNVVYTLQSNGLSS